MTIPTEMLQKLATPQPLAHMTSRLPSKFARTNAELIAALAKKGAK